MVSGRPIPPDWSLSQHASDISDLIHWDYCHPEDDDGADAEFEVDDAAEPLVSEILDEFKTSIELRLSPALKRAKRRMDDALSKDVLLSTTIAAIRTKRNYKQGIRALQKKNRKALGEKMRGKIRDRMKLMSRGEALALMVPEASASSKTAMDKSKKRKLKRAIKAPGATWKEKLKACLSLKRLRQKKNKAKKQLKKKPSAKKKGKKKPSLKSKPSLKTKLSAQIKKKIKTGMKSLTKTKLKKILGDEAPALLPPAPPPADPPEEAPEEAAGPPEFQKNDKVRLISESLGASRYGVEGKVLNWNASTQRLTIQSDGSKAGAFFTEHKSVVVNLNSNSFSPRLKWLSLKLMSRAQQKCLLLQEGFFAEYGDEVSQVVPMVVLGVDASLLDSEHLDLCVELLRWNSEKAGHENLQVLGLRVVPPLLTARLALSKLKAGEAEWTEVLRRAVLEYAQGAKLLLCPVFGDDPGHWTLLSMSIELGELRSVRYYDSLTQLHDICRANAADILSIFSLRPFCLLAAPP